MWSMVLVGYEVLLCDSELWGLSNIVILQSTNRFMGSLVMVHTFECLHIQRGDLDLL